jgi:hypothetical protein
VGTSEIFLSAFQSNGRIRCYDWRHT